MIKVKSKSKYMYFTPVVKVLFSYCDCMVTTQHNQKPLP